MKVFNKTQSVITRSAVQMEIGNEFLHFYLIRNWTVHHKKDHIKFSQFTKFEVLSLECDHVEVFQNSEKLEILYESWGLHLRSRYICMEFRQPLTGHSLVTTQ